MGPQQGSFPGTLPKTNELDKSQEMKTFASCFAVSACLRIFSSGVNLAYSASSLFNFPAKKFSSTSSSCSDSLSGSGCCEGVGCSLIFGGRLAFRVVVVAVPLGIDDRGGRPRFLGAGVWNGLKSTKASPSLFCLSSCGRNDADRRRCFRAD